MDIILTQSLKWCYKFQFRISPCSTGGLDSAYFMVHNILSWLNSGKGWAQYRAETGLLPTSAPMELHVWMPARLTHRCLIILLLLDTHPYPMGPVATAPFAPIMHVIGWATYGPASWDLGSWDLRSIPDQPRFFFFLLYIGDEIKTKVYTLLSNSWVTRTLFRSG